MFTWFTKVNKPKPDQAISVHLLHAASRVELTDRCQPMATDSACSWNLYRLDLELGVSYTLQVQSGSEILTVISITTPGTSKQTHCRLLINDRHNVEGNARTVSSLKGMQRVKIC